MTKAHTGHNGNRGIQNHSCGEFYPVVVSCVGGYPGPENDAYYKLIPRFRWFLSILTLLTIIGILRDVTQIGIDPVVPVMPAPDYFRDFI